MRTCIGSWTDRLIKKKEKKTWHGADKSDNVWSTSIPLPSRLPASGLQGWGCIAICNIALHRQQLLSFVLLHFHCFTSFLTTATIVHWAIVFGTKQETWATCRIIRTRYFLRHQNLFFICFLHALYHGCTLILLGLPLFIYIPIIILLIYCY